jgi:hypothetical protein
MKHYNEIVQSYNVEPHKKKQGELDKFLKIIEENELGPLGVKLYFRLICINDND